LHRGDDQTDQNPNDRDHHEQFNQAKSRTQATSVHKKPRYRKSARPICRRQLRAGAMVMWDTGKQ
jgi:hypothetical protein